MSRKPIHSLRARGMDVAIWEGNTGPQFTFRKTYKDRDSGEWKESKILFRQDILALVTLLEEALAKSATDEGMRDDSNFGKQEEKDFAKAKHDVKPDFDDSDLPF